MSLPILIGGIAGLLGILLGNRISKTRSAWCERWNVPEIDRHSRLITIPSQPSKIRQAIIANALSVVDLQAGNPDTIDLFRELLGPPAHGQNWDLGRPFTVWIGADGNYQTKGVSTCGLVAEGIWRRCGVDMPSLYAPYVVASSIGRARAFAMKHGALKEKVLPLPGDYVCVGSKLSTHVRTMVSLGKIPIHDPKDGKRLALSVDGGQVMQRGLQGVATLERNYSIPNWCIDVTRLPLRSMWTVPEEWESVVVNA